MTWEAVALVAVLNLLSIGWFLAVRKAVIHVTKSYVKILGAENRHMVFTGRLAAIRAFYLLSVIGMIFFSGYIIYLYL